MAPSAFILYLGVNGTIPSLQHHNLLFSEHWNENFEQIFKKPVWPTDPSLYVCAPSKTDPTVAPDDAFLDTYTDFIIDQMSVNMDIPDFKNRIEYKKVYAVNDFIADYNSFKGSALGLAHSLSQTAIFRPNNVHKTIKNLLYVGAGTNPGIGMPICLISAELVYKRLENIKDPAPLQKI
jgi:phytoene desaturase